MRRRVPVLFLLALLVPLFVIFPTSRMSMPFQSTGLVMISEEGVIGNPGFETGIFSPWVNVEGVSENQIQSSVVYTGSYALQMDSIYSIWAWVDQDLASPVVLSGNTTFSAAIYPTATGNTCGAYGRAQVTIYVNNTDTGVSRRIRYIWNQEYMKSES